MSRIDTKLYNKRKLLATAISHMYMIVANDWSSTTMYSFLKKHPELESIAKNVEPVLDLAVEEEMEQLYETLKLYYKEDDSNPS
jgi:hypothetical protein